MNKIISIDGRKIGMNQQPYIIAELSANHNGNIGNALEAVRVAHEMGADAIKIQTYTADTMTIDCDSEDFMIKGGLWAGHSLYGLYKEAQTPFEWHKQIFDYAKELGITIFSTPFDETAVDLLESLNAPAYKIASFEATDLPLIQYVARTGKPMIISTGMCSEEDISDAVMTAKNAGCTDLVLLHCTSSYPAPIEHANLSQIPALRDRFGTVIGLSDHTLGTAVALSAVALGASIVEKHFTLDRSEKGPDSEFSIEPKELKALCSGAKEVFASIGRAGYKRHESELANKQFRRSIYFVRDLKAGDTITEQDIRRIRPGFGLAPKFFDDLLGKKVAIDVEKGTASTWELIRE